MQYPDHLKPEDRFLRIVFFGSLAAAEPMEEFATWCITGVAAIVALVLANLATVSKIISETGLRWGIVFLALSMLAGVVAKQFGIAIRKGIALLEALYAELSKPEAREAMANMTWTTEELQKKMAEPFLWPVKGMMIRAARRGATDSLSGEKRFIQLLCIQVFASAFQSASATVGILVLAFGIK
jgi:hypothetical protein